MKAIIPILILTIAIIACGCTTAAPATPVPATTAPAAIPDITGTWTGPMQGYDEKTGFTDYPALSIVLNITEQHGRIFSGDVLFTENGTTTSSGFAGAIGRDGRTLSIAEHDGGYSFGQVVGPDEIEFTYLQDGSPYSAAIDSFRRVRSG